MSAMSAAQSAMSSLGNMGILKAATGGKQDPPPSRPAPTPSANPLIPQ